jgi:hypothetical protein
VENTSCSLDWQACVMQPELASMRTRARTEKVQNLIEWKIDLGTP